MVVALVSQAAEQFVQVVRG